MHYKKLIATLVILAIVVSVLFFAQSGKIHALNSEIDELTNDIHDTIISQEELIQYQQDQIRTLKEALSDANKELLEQSRDMDRLIDDMMEMTASNKALISKTNDLTAENEHLNEISKYVYNGEWHYDYTDEEVALLAGVMFGECEDAGRLEQAFVGSVVLNRVLSPLFPNTVHDVVYQIDSGYEQYAPRTKRIAEAVVANKPISSKDADVKYLPDYYFELAEILLKYGPVAPDFVLYQAHFNQGKVFWNYKGEQFCYKGES